MTDKCSCIHRLANDLQRHRFPFDNSLIPQNGLYLLFEKGEKGHNQDRIVRIGTHTGNNQLPSRLKQHFLNENKDRSIFRKNIGRALLNKNSDSFLEYWELDLTTKKARTEYSSLIDFEYQEKIEKQVSRYIQDKFSFGVIEVKDKKDRLQLEAKIISTVSWCEECKPSSNWLGNMSPKEKIVQSGLWQVNELYKTPFDTDEIKALLNIVKH